MNIIFRILIFILVLVLLYYFIRYLTNNNNTLTTSVISGNQMTTIAPSSLAQNGNGSNSTNYTYSIWFYITDWNYRYGEPKVLFGRMGKPTSTTSISGISGAEPCPLVNFGAIENNIDVSLSVYPNATSSPTPTTTSANTSTNYIVHTCSIQNIPIQSWTNLLISTYGRTLDIYLNGKLVRTCLLPGVAQINPNSNLYVTPNGGFSGFTSKFQYYPNSTDPQTAWNIYKQGYTSNLLSQFGGNYQVKVEILNNGMSTASTTS